MLIMASLQLVPNIFLLFYHHASGKYSHKKASYLSLFFILGAEIISAFFFITAFFIASVLFLNNLNPRNNILTWIFAGILVSLSIITFFFYYRPGHKKDTELFISRRLAHTIVARTKTIKTPLDAFALGALSNIYELFLTLPLYIITATEIMYMHTEYLADNLMTVLYIITPTIPLLCLYHSLRLGHNLADIHKSQIKDKIFHRFIISFSFLTIAILIINFRII